MEPPSTSRSLTNQAFDTWLEGRLKLVENLKQPTTANHLLRNIDLQLMPFVTYNEKEPVRVRVRVGGEEVRGILKIFGPSHSPVIYLVSSHYQKKPVAVDGSSVVRYLAWGSKRWRAPKEFHKDMAALYTLRYR